MSHVFEIRISYLISILKEHTPYAAPGRHNQIHPASFPKGFEMCHFVQLQVIAPNYSHDEEGVSFCMEIFIGEY